MGRVPFPGIEEETEELVALSKSATRREYMRLQALLLIKKDLVTSRQHIADILSVHRQTVSECLENYEKGGLPLLLEDDKPSPTSHDLDDWYASLQPNLLLSIVQFPYISHAITSGLFS